MTTQIEKIFKYKYKSYEIVIERNKRKDCFLKITKVNNLKSYERPEIYLPKNKIGVSVFLNLKSAKSKAMEIIDCFEK